MRVPHYNVIFATPGHSMTSGYVKSLLNTVELLNKENISWKFISQYSSLVSHAREATASNSSSLSASDKTIGKGLFTYDKIMWIDSDIEWDPIDFFRLYESNKDIVSGCYMLTDGKSLSVAAYLEPLSGSMTPQQILNSNGLIEVFGTGFGFICIKNGVFESMPRPWFSQEGIGEITNGTRTVNSKDMIIGEDLAWCTKAQRSGYKIYLDTDVKVVHQKSTKLNWSFSDI